MRGIWKLEGEHWGDYQECHFSSDWVPLAPQASTLILRYHAACFSVIAEQAQSDLQSVAGSSHRTYILVISVSSNVKNTP